ncbi:MAG: hypothetical protein P8X91_01850 [Candidatus Bathyarchaeota archaeon]
MKSVHKIIFPGLIGSLIITSIILFSIVNLSLVNAQGQAANLTGTIFDQGIDSTGDGNFDSLEIGIQVNVSTSGIFNIEVSGLYDSKSNINISSQNSTFLNPGLQSVHVFLLGTTIYSSKVNPTNISMIILEDESGNQIDSLTDISLSQDYYYFNFGVKPASLTETITDEGIDNNDDGYFDFLRLGVEVNVAIAGTYSVDAGGIYDPSYNSVSVLTQNSTFLNSGVQFVYLDLNGAEIYTAVVNPTTIASIFLNDSSGNTLSELHDLSLPTTYSFDQFQRPPTDIELTEVERQIMLNQAGNIYVANSYWITNLGFTTNIIELGVPDDAYDFTVRDEMGNLEITNESEIITINLRRALNQSAKEPLYVFYHLPWKNHIDQTNNDDFTTSFTYYENFNKTIGLLKTSVILPDGAEFKSSNPIDPQTIKKNAIQETLVFEFSNVSTSQNLDFEINYRYQTFWASFYPTIWIGILAFSGAVVAFFWKVPKTSVSSVIPIQTKTLNNFVESYEAKTRIRAELESLDERVQKGKIPRRRYKVRKKMLDGRISTISRNLSSLGEEIRSAGSKYAKMIKQLEVAETKLEGAKKDLQELELRYRKAEISKATYLKLFEENQNKIDDAETTIDGVLIRLRE